MLNASQITSIVPAAAGTTSPTYSPSSPQGGLDPIFYKWTNGTNAAMLSHLKHCFGPSFASASVFNPVQPGVGVFTAACIGIPQTNTPLGAALSTQTCSTNSFAPSQLFQITSSGVIRSILFPNLCVGTTDQATVSLVPLDSNPPTWTLNSDGSVALNGTSLFMSFNYNPGAGMAPGQPITLVTSSPMTWSVAQAPAVIPGSGVLGNVPNYVAAAQPGPNLVFPELPSLTFAPLQGSVPSSIATATPPNVQSVSRYDVLAGLQNPTTYAGWTSDLA